MAVARFLSKLAFICNICFLISFAMHYFPTLKNSAISSTIIILGNVLAIVVNILAIATYLLYSVQKKSPGVARWVMIVNGLCFVFQIMLLLK